MSNAQVVDFIVLCQMLQKWTISIKLIFYSPSVKLTSKLALAQPLIKKEVFTNVVYGVMTAQNFCIKKLRLQIISKSTVSLYSVQYKVQIKYPAVVAEWFRRLLHLNLWLMLRPRFKSSSGHINSK